MKEKEEKIEDTLMKGNKGKRKLGKRSIKKRGY